MGVQKECKFDYYFLSVLRHEQRYPYINQTRQRMEPAPKLEEPHEMSSALWSWVCWWWTSARLRCAPRSRPQQSRLRRPLQAEHLEHRNLLTGNGLQVLLASSPDALASLLVMEGSPIGILASSRIIARIQADKTSARALN